MDPTEHPPNSPSNPSVEDDTVEQSLHEAEGMLRDLKTRYEQIRLAQVQQPQLESRLLELKAEKERYTKNTSHSHNPDIEARLSELKTELETVKTQLATTWETLESQLITWRDKEELFWQFLRFAGVGFALALLMNWILK